MKVGDIATVEANGRLFTGKVYHVRENGWACVETDNGHYASGPTRILPTEWAGQELPTHLIDDKEES